MFNKNKQTNSPTQKWTNSEEYDRVNLWQPSLGTSNQQNTNGPRSQENTSKKKPNSTKQNNKHKQSHLEPKQWNKNYNLCHQTNQNKTKNTNTNQSTTTYSKPPENRRTIINESQPTEKK